MTGLRPCLFPRCRTPAQYGSHCRQHGRPRGPRSSYDALYGTSRWRDASKQYLATHPRCVCPQHHGQPDAPRATVVDHITPHKGDLTLFWDAENWQALSKPCHDSWKKRTEHHMQANA